MKEKYNILYDGESFQKEVLSLIESSKEKIILQTYIFEYDDFGKRVYASLIKKAKEGVWVEVVLDFFGSYSFYKVQKQLEKHRNFQCLYFNTLRFPSILQFGRRIHHKVFIIDHHKAIIGGINIKNGIEESGHPRFDFALSITSPQLPLIEKYCQRIFKSLNQKTVERPPKNKRYTPKTNQLKASILVNDWFEGRKQITKSYHHLLKQASSEILLIHGYFFPSIRTIKKLRDKARAGVRVRLILPRYSDWQGWVWATEFLYPFMMSSGIEVYEWTLSHLHGKLGVFDRKIVSIGSHNLNYTSSFGNLEMNVLVHDSKFGEKVITDIENKVSSGAELVTDENYRKYPIRKKLLCICCFLILNIIARVSVIWIVSIKLINKIR